jgi:hypothetical protein
MMTNLFSKRWKKRVNHSDDITEKQKVGLWHLASVDSLMSEMCHS